MNGQRRQREPRAKRDRSGFSLLAVQSIVCGVVLLLALLLRLVGGDTWTQLRSLFRQWMTEEGLTQVIAEQLEEEEATQGVGGRDIAVGEAVSVLRPPQGATFAPPTVPITAITPLKSGRVTSSFGYRTDPIKGGTGFHTGIDVAASKGEPLYALYDGVVTAAAWDSSYGNYIAVTTAEGWELWYAHCSVLLCREGESVTAGQRIAQVGSTGDSTGDHVHIMVKHDGVCYDPTSLIPEGWYA